MKNLVLENLQRRVTEKRGRQQAEAQEPVWQKNFRRGLWDERMLEAVTRKGVATPADYKRVTGKDYVKPR